MKIALVGNQNSGKTTLFNNLTGMNCKIGNWPGVTLEKKSGVIKGTSFEIVDLPGIYSLSPYTLEENVSRDYIFREIPDVIINIVDSTSLERSLYLTTQLLELDCKVIVALNMVDIAQKHGLFIDTHILSSMLGTKVIEISALKGTGIDELIQYIKQDFIENKPHIYSSSIENSIFAITNYLPKNALNKRFTAVKLLENDAGFKKHSFFELPSILKLANKNYDTDLEEVIATERYNFAETLKIKAVSVKETPVTKSDKIDKFILNKWLAFPVFAIIMFVVYFVSVGVIGTSTSNYISNFVHICSSFMLNLLEKFGTSKLLISLILDGVVAGVGTVLGFIPQLTMLFLCVSLLETSGYMSRIALILDRIFKKLGLSGKSIIPFIVGSRLQCSWNYGFQNY